MCSSDLGELSPAGRRTAVQTVRDYRRLLRAIGETATRVTAAYPSRNLFLGRRIEAWPDDFLSIDELVPAFVQTAFLFERPEGPARGLDINGDWGNRPEFVSSFTITLRESRPSGESVQRRLSWGCLQPPCVTSESVRRRKLMRELGRGLPWPGAAGFRPGRLQDRLGPVGRRTARALPVEEQLALMMVLAADRDVCAFMSPSGRWPREPMVLRKAGSLGVKIVRFTFDGVPADVRERLPEVRYEKYVSIPGR